MLNMLVSISCLDTVTPQEIVEAYSVWSWILTTSCCSRKSFPNSCQWTRFQELHALHLWHHHIMR